jgi:hypothetical protein
MVLGQAASSDEARRIVKNRDLIRSSIDRGQTRSCAIKSRGALPHGERRDTTTTSLRLSVNGIDHFAKKLLRRRCWMAILQIAKGGGRTDSVGFYGLGQPLPFAFRRCDQNRTERGNYGIERSVLRHWNPLRKCH